MYIVFVNFGISIILRTISVISSPLSHSMVTSDTLFFLVECTSCIILLILVSSLPWENPQYCLVLHTVAGKLHCPTADFSQLAAILAVPCFRVVNTCVDFSTSNLSDYCIYCPNIIFADLPVAVLLHLGLVVSHVLGLAIAGLDWSWSGCCFGWLF